MARVSVSHASITNELKYDRSQGTVLLPADTGRCVVRERSALWSILNMRFQRRRMSCLRKVVQQGACRCGVVAKWNGWRHPPNASSARATERVRDD